MRFDLGTLDSGERSLPFGLLVILVKGMQNSVWGGVMVSVSQYASSIFTKVKNYFLLLFGLLQVISNASAPHVSVFRRVFKNVTLQILIFSQLVN